MLFEADHAFLQGEFEKAKSQTEACMSYEGNRENIEGLGYLLRRLGQCHHQLGQAAKAAGFIKESLTLNWGNGDKQGVAACMSALAALAMSLGQQDKATALFAAVDVALKSIHSRLLHIDQMAYDLNVTTLRETLDPTTFTAAWTEGQTLTTERAIEIATSNSCLTLTENETHFPGEAPGDSQLSACASFSQMN